MLQQAGKKTLLVDRWPRPGGRLQSYPQSNGYIIENGLHIVEMGKKGFATRWPRAWAWRSSGGMDQRRGNSTSTANGWATKASSRKARTRWSTSSKSCSR